MEGSPPAAILRRALVELRAGGKLPPVLETLGFDPAPPSAGERFETPPSEAELAEVGFSSEVWLLCRAEEAVGRMWPHIFQGSGSSGPRVLARFDGSSPEAPVADLGAFSAIPRCQVAAPADGASTASVVPALIEHPAPSYVRVPLPSEMALSDGSFRWGCAPVLRDGSDLTLIGVGPVLAALRALAGRLQGIGVSARLLDGASVKPVDAPAILRAARETGGILTAEEHNVASGFGASVAAVTALGYPVPVRRLGFPDLPATELEPSPLSAARLDEEAWELLKVRGKVQ